MTSAGTGFILKRSFYGRTGRNICLMIRGGLYSVCKKHLSIPEGSNPREIWGRVIVPSIRDKF
jgi:hypothetical protein